MSMFRKAAVGVVVLGAGLASTSGVALATQSHGHGHEGGGNSCSNAIAAKNTTEGKGLVSVAGGDQVPVAINACHILNDNKVANKNNVAAVGGTIHNGDS